MSKPRLRRLAFAAIVPLLTALSGCAAMGAGSGTGGPEIAIEVVNDLLPPTTLSVYAVTDTGVRRLIGNVTPGSTSVLRFDPVASSGRYTFVARTTAGDDRVSNPISLSEGETARWSVNSNLIVQRQQ